MRGSPTLLSELPACLIVMAGMGPELQDPYSLHREHKHEKEGLTRALCYPGHEHAHEDAGGLVQEVLLLLGGAFAAHAVLDHIQQWLK